MHYTNYSDIPLPLAVWLAADTGYDLKYDPEVISATTLMKPIRSVILSRRLLEEQEQGTIDVNDLVQANLGTAVHTAVEDTWLYHREAGLKNLGVSKAIVDDIRLNPDSPADAPDPDLILYMERRSFREIQGQKQMWRVSGKFDIVWQGRVADIKTTKTYNYIAGTNDDKYALQGSIYRWLNPDIIEDDYIDVYMLFTDWSELKAKADPKYPQNRIITRTLPLLSMEETESYVRSRITEMEMHMDKPNDDLPLCTPEELWMDPPKWAFYRDKTKTARATKLYDNAAEAHLANSKTNGKGLVTKRDSEPKFCRYCPARPVCTQAEQYIANGQLKI